MHVLFGLPRRVSPCSGIADDEQSTGNFYNRKKYIKSVFPVKASMLSKCARFLSNPVLCRAYVLNRIWELRCLDWLRAVWVFRYCPIRTRIMRRADWSLSKSLRRRAFMPSGEQATRMRLWKTFSQSFKSFQRIVTNTGINKAFFYCENHLQNRFCLIAVKFTRQTALVSARLTKKRCRANTERLSVYWSDILKSANKSKGLSKRSTSISPLHPRKLITETNGRADYDKMACPFQFLNRRIFFCNQFEAIREIYESQARPKAWREY